MSSTSESTFGNQLEHSRTLQVALGKMAGFKPDNTALEPATYKGFLDTVELRNETVAGAGQVLSDERSARRLGFFGNAKQGVAGLGTLSGRVRDYVGSMPGGKTSAAYRHIQKLTQKISNYRRPRKKVSSSPGTTEANKKEISRSEASYGSLVQDGRDLAAAAAKVPGYNPNAPDLAPAALKAAMQVLADHNTAVAGALIDAQKAIDDRAFVYEDQKAGARAQFQQAKAAVASQFGRRSPQYKSISHIRY